MLSSYYKLKKMHTKTKTIELFFPHSFIAMNNNKNLIRYFIIKIEIHLAYSLEGGNPNMPPKSDHALHE